jgi:peptidoglycan hydrolase-like protein with peptidoglycan-binding domain
MKTIVASVGRGGLNRTEDVFLVQELLNRHIQAPQRPLVVDGVMSSRTIAAIEAFQRRVVNIHRPDGRIDPGDCTMAALARQAEQAPIA